MQLAARVDAQLRGIPFWSADTEVSHIPGTSRVSDHRVRHDVCHLASANEDAFGTAGEVHHLGYPPQGLDLYHRRGRRDAPEPAVLVQRGRDEVPEHR